MLVSNKHFVPVIGLDIHIVVILGVPVPLPHPYIGFVMDPMDYIPFIGATTKVNHVPRGKSDTSGIIVILFHIPMGGPFLLAPMIGHDSVNFFGSKTVKVEGNLMSPAGHMLMTCNDIGMPLSLKPGKKWKPIPSMYLPTSFSIPLSFGQPVMVGGPFVPDWFGVLLNLIMSYGFGALLKGLGKTLNKILKRELGATNRLSKLLCKLGFEPVDLVQGIVVYEGTDFELPGPIPLKWERCWNSDSKLRGWLGHGMSSSYEMKIVAEEGATGLLLGDGRCVVFDALPYPGSEDYHRHEKLTLTRTDIDEYQLFNHSERLYYVFRLYGEEYHLQTVRNEAGFMISFHYNGNGRLVRIIDSVGRHLKVSHDSMGRIVAVTVHHRDAIRELVRYSYNDQGDLTGITDALEQTTVITYEDHRMTAKTDRNGQSFYWEYDKQGRCVHTWGDGGILEGWIEYHPEDGYNLVTNAQGHTTTYFYSPDFVVSQIKDPLGNSQFFEYTDDFELYREIDEEGNVTGYTYDEKGNVVRITRPDGAASSFSYDKEGRLIVAADPNGDSCIYSYYENTGMPLTITQADGSISIFHYNDHLLPAVIEDEEGNACGLSYDEDYNLSKVQLPDGGQSYWKYDVWGNCIQAVNPLQQEQYFRYDALGRVTAVSMADGNHIQLQYNAYNNVIDAKDKQHHVKFEYTPLGNLKLRDENGTKVHFIYNRDEQLTSLVNEHGEMYRFTRNGRGDIIQETGFDGITRAYDRDAAGKVVKIHRPGGRWTTCEYDYNGNLTRAQHSDGYWEQFSYDRAGQLIEAVNEHSTVKLQRDARGRVLEEWQNEYGVTSSYDGHGNRRSLKSTLGADIAFERNAMGDVTGMDANAVWHTNIERNLLGLEIERTLPGGVKSSWTFDKGGMPDSHIVTSNGRDTRRKHYHWDANQRLKQLMDGLQRGAVKFGHDELGNLAWAQYENGEYDYRLPDKAGNIYTSPEGRDRRYGPGGQLQETAGARFQYDEEGNLLKKIADTKVWEYEWYGHGMLKKVVRPDGRAVTFTYDAMGRRIEKQYNGRITRFVWDGDVPLHEWTYPTAEKPVLEIGELGDVQQNHPEPVPAETLTTWVFTEGMSVPAAKLVNGQQYSIISDHLGTPCQAFDNSGEKVWECELDISGKVRKLAGDPDLVPFRYQGQYEDPETGLYYNRFRYYSPDEGRYISKDPVGVQGGLNQYSYVRDTNKWIDPNGLHSVPVPYGSTDMSQMAQAYRMENGISGGRNVAVFEYMDDNNELQYAISESAGRHSERRIGAHLDDIGIQPEKVTRIYTELEPCVIPGGKCKDWIDGRFKNASVTHSFEYGATRESRRQGVKDLKKAVKALFKCP